MQMEANSDMTALVAYWKSEGVTPDQVWMASGGHPLKFRVTWNDVERLLVHGREPLDLDRQPELDLDISS